MHRLLCNELKNENSITEEYLNLALTETLTQINLLTDSILDNRLNPNHQIARNINHLCVQTNFKVKNANKYCADIMKNEQNAAVINIEYVKTKNQFVIHLHLNLPLFHLVNNGTIEQFIFPKNLKQAENSTNLKIAKINSENFIRISGPEMGHPLYYKDVKFDPVSQAVIIDGEQNSDWWDESVIHCLFQNNNISCPIVTYRSRTRCIVEKFVSLHKLKFVHFASNQNLEVTRISPKTFHGVLYQKDSEVGRKSKVFQRYQKTKVQVKCGLSLLDLGTSPHTTELNITLKNLTNNLHVLDPLLWAIRKTSQRNF